MRIVAAGGADVTISSPLQAAGADGQTNSTSGIPTYDLLSGFNGTTWDRLRALGDDADGVASASLGRLLALARLSGYNGATWDRLLSEGNDRDAIANTTLGNLQTLGFQHVYNGASWDRATLLTDASDAVSTDTSFGQGGVSRLTGFNGSTYDRVRMLGDTALDGLGQVGVSLGIPGASVVKMLHVTLASGTARATAITPGSGKRIRILSVGLRSQTSTRAMFECYFGTGGGITTDTSKAIMDFNLDQDVSPNGFHNWADGSGPVGAANDVVSVRSSEDSGSSTAIVFVYREE